MSEIYPFNKCFLGIDLGTEEKAVNKMGGGGDICTHGDYILMKEDQKTN